MALSARARTVLILALAPVLVYLALLNVTDRLEWKSPWDGIRWAQAEGGLRVVEVVSRDVPAGIEPGMLLVDISGLSVESLDQYTEILETLAEASPDGMVVDYTFRGRDGSEITYPLDVELRAQFGAGDVPLLLVAFAFLFIGVLTYLRNEQAPGAFHFSILCLVAFVLLAFRYSGRADWFDILGYWLSGAAFLLLPPLFLHFTLVFPRKRSLIDDQPFLPALVYAPALLLGLFHAAWFAGGLRWIGLPRTPELGQVVDKIELVHFLVLFLLAAGIVFRSRQTSARAVHRKQMQWITSGTILGILPFSFFYILPYLLDLPIAGWMKASVLSLAFIPLSFGYAIGKFRLQDVDLIFKRGVAYVVASSALLAFYVGVALLIASALQNISPGSGFVLLALSALAVAAFFAPLRDKIQEQLDRYFYKDRYGYRRSFLDFGRTLAAEIHLPRLTEKISGRLQKALDVSPVTVFIRDSQEGNLFHLETSLDLITLDRPAAIEVPDRLIEELTIDTGSVDLESTDEALAPVRQNLYRWGVRYVEPLSVRGRLIGFLGLGRRRNGDLLTSEDLELVETLSGYAAIAIDNALLYRSLESKAGELMELRTYSESVIESINLGVGVIDPSGKLTVWNSSMTRITGVPQQEAVGQRLDEVLPSGLLASLGEILDDPNWQVEESNQLYKARLERLEGDAILVNASLSPFVSHENFNTGTLLVLDDVTEKVRLENQLQQAERLSSIGLFAAGLAHEVNTPLAGISSYAQMILKETSREDSRYELLRKIEKQSFRASEIINNLLNFARFSDRDFEEVNLNSLMLETLSLLEHQFRKSDIEIDLDFEPALPKTVGNGGKLQQVFMNLFLNARDSMPTGGRLRLSTQVENSQVILRVADTGTGISREDIKKIYDPFFTTKAVGKGTGLGLSVSYGIIQEHSGRIAVESEPGKGTVFSLYLPLKRVH